MKKWRVTGNELEKMAGVVHGGIWAGNMLCVIFHLLRKRWGYALIHLGLVAYETGAIKAHILEKVPSPAQPQLPAQ